MSAGDVARVVHVRAHHVICPYCGAEVYGWYCDPRGTETTCDECGDDFTVAPDAELVLR